MKYWDLCIPIINYDVPSSNYEGIYIQHVCCRDEMAFCNEHWTGSVQTECTHTELVAQQILVTV